MAKKPSNSLTTETNSSDETHSPEVISPEVISPEVISPELLEQLSSQLVWRIGRLSDDEPITVRLGFAGATQRFGDLPRLKNVADEDIEQAMQAGTIKVEWVGHRA